MFYKSEQTTPRAFVRLYAILSVAMAGGAVDSAQGEITISPQLLRGDRAPETEGGLTLNQFQDVRFNNRGELLFSARLVGPGLDFSRSQGIWRGRPESLHLLVREGDPAPVPEPNVEYNFFLAPILSHSGRAWFYGGLRGEGISDDRFNPGNDDTISTVTPVIDVHDEQSEWIILNPGFEPDLAGRNNSARGKGVVDLGSRDSYVNGEIDRRDHAGNVVAASGYQFIGPFAQGFLALEGEDAPGTAEQFTTLAPGLHDAVLTTRGRVAFTASIPDGQGIWFGRFRDLQPVVLPNAPVFPSLVGEPGAGATWDSTLGDAIGLNAREELVFSSGGLLVAGTPEHARVVARAESNAEEGFRVLGTRIVINAAGDVAFLAQHTSLGPPSFANGLWMTYRRGDPFLVLAEGNPAAGLEDGEVLSFFEEGPYMNRLGQVAVRAGIGPAVGFDQAVDNGLWLIDPMRGPQLVARGGTEVMIGGGETRTLLVRFATAFFNSHFRQFSGGEDGRVNPLNDHGDLVFVGQWDGGGVGIFTARDPSASLSYEDWAERICRLTGDDARPLADPDRDGACNLIEFGLDSIPDDPADRPVLPRPLFDDQGRAILIVEKAPGIDGLRFELQRSNDLRTWTTDGLTVLEDSAYRLVVRMDSPAPSQWFRLQLVLAGE